MNNEFKQKLINEIEEQLYIVNFNIAYNQSIMPGVQEKIVEHKTACNETKQKLDDESAKKEKSHKREVRENIKKLAHEYGNKTKILGRYEATKKLLEDNIQANEEKKTGLEAKLEFARNYSA